MRYKDKKSAIIRRFKEKYSRKEVLERLEEIGFDEHCDIHDCMKVRLKGGEVLSETYLTPRSEVDERLYKSWGHSYRDIEFSLFKDYCISLGYTITKEVKKIDFDKEHSLENIRIVQPMTSKDSLDIKLHRAWKNAYMCVEFEAFKNCCISLGFNLDSKVCKKDSSQSHSLENMKIHHPMKIETDLDAKLHNAWRHAYKHINFEVFKKHCISLGCTVSDKVLRVDTNEPYALENIRIHKELTEKDKTMYSLLRKNHYLIHSNITLKQLKEIAIKSNTYVKLDYPFIDKDFKVIPLEESSLTSTQQKQIKRETKITQDIDMLMFEYQIRFKTKDLKALRDYIEFCINNHQENPIEYVEEHHILMRSLFPEYECFKENPWNKATLNKKDHIEAHRLLYCSVDEDSTRNAYNRVLSSSNEEGEFLGKSVIIFDYLGNEIERFPSKKMTESKYGFMNMLYYRSKFFDQKDPKIAIYENEFTVERLNECVDFLKTNIIHVKNLETEEVEKFLFPNKLREKYNEFIDFRCLLFNEIFVVYYPHREKHKSRLKDARNLFNLFWFNSHPLVGFKSSI